MSEVKMSFYREGQRPVVSLDGVEVQDYCQRVEFSAGVDQVPTLRLDLIPTKMEIDGVDVEVEELPNIMATLNWLGSLSPSEVEKRVLEMPLGDSLSTGEAFLKVISDLAAQRTEVEWPEDL